MTGWKDTHGRATYKYVLMVQDVFSRYVWLKPLKGKSSHEIARHLEDIYMEHGPPKVLQHDQEQLQMSAIHTSQLLSNVGLTVSPLKQKTLK